MLNRRFGDVPRRGRQAGSSRSCSPCPAVVLGFVLGLVALVVQQLAFGADDWARFQEAAVWTTPAFRIALALMLFDQLWDAGRFAIRIAPLPAPDQSDDLHLQRMVLRVVFLAAAGLAAGLAPGAGRARRRDRARRVHVDAGGLARGHASAGAGRRGRARQRRGRRGRCTSKVAPAPGALCTRMTPAWMCTTSRARYRPMPAPPCVRLRPAVHREELLEDPVVVLGGDADAVVAHGHARVLPVGAQPHRHVPAPGRELDGVLDQVVQEQVEQALVTGQRRNLLDRLRQPHPLDRGLGPERPQRGPQRLGEHDRAPVHGPLRHAHLQARQLQHLVDHPAQPLAVLQGHAAELLALRLEVSPPSAST